MPDLLINKVLESGIVTLDLENYYPKQAIEVFDMKEHLFMGLILKEKDFREALKLLDLAKYKGKIAAITCSADAVIPMWAYMLAASVLEPVAEDILFGSEEEVTRKLLLKNIRQIDVADFTDKRLVIKGCGEKSVPPEAYIEATQLLRPVARSIMYGEPCSTVPVYKKPKVG